MVAVLAGCLIFLAMMSGLFIPLEAFFPAQPLRRERAAPVLGVVLFFANTVLMQWLGVPVLLMLNAVGQALHLTRSGALVVVLVFITSDLFGYAMHRAMHRVKFLWRFHAVHHQAVELSWLDAWRQHPVDFVLHGIAVGVPGALVGASLSEIASVVVLRKAFTTFLHANLRVDFGLVLASPAFHRVHHSDDPTLHDSNFAGTFPLWDVFFGTHASRRAQEERHRVGVALRDGEVHAAIAVPVAAGERSAS